MSAVDYPKLAKSLVARAKKSGAQQAEVFLQVGRESSVRVRDGEIEDLTQATSKGVGIRVFAKNRLGFAFTSDFNPKSLESFVDRAVELAKAAAPNALNGLPEKNELKKRPKLEGLFDNEVAELAPDWKIQRALEIEKAGKSHDPRIKTFESVGAGDYVSEVHIASSEGLLDSYSGTYVYLYAVPVAQDSNGQLQTSYWVDYKRFLKDLDSAEAVGKEAARRAVRMLGARKVKTQRVPVIFDQQMAASFVGNIASAANGDSIFKKSSIFAPLLGKKVAAENVSIVDDGLLPRGIASSPFDGEGVPTRKTSIIEKGVLRSFLYDAFTARKAKTKSTGNASRGYSSLPHIGINNLYMEPGSTPPDEMIRGVKNGFYVTAMLGSGANPVTGDYSRGANGMWIENGELAFPVQEVTVAGNLLKMLEGVDAIGSDLEFRGSVAAPTIRFAELTVSGE
ncbi:MAG: TldD/PmbA family protein [Myxococcaceae bacterium]